MCIYIIESGRGSTDMSYTWNEYGRPSVYTAMSVGAEVAAGEIDGAHSYFHLYQMKSHDTDSQFRLCSNLSRRRHLLRHWLPSCVGLFP
jgi:hypothetical protein